MTARRLYRTAWLYWRAGIFYLKGRGYARHLRIAADLAILIPGLALVYLIMARFYTIPIPVG